MIHLQTLESLADELEKIAATVVMKELTPAAKAFMKKLTGFGRRARRLPTQMVKQQQSLKRDLKGIPIVTDPDMDHLPTRKLVISSRKKLDDMLRRTGRAVESPKTKALQKRRSRPTIAATPLAKKREAA